MYSSGQPFRTEHHHLVTGLHQMTHRLRQTGDDAIHLRQEGFGEEGDFQRRVADQEAVPMAWAWVLVQAEVQRMRLRSQRSA